MFETKNNEVVEVSQLYPHQTTTIGRIIDCINIEEDYSLTIDHITNGILEANQNNTIECMKESHSKCIAQKHNFFYKLISLLERINKSFEFGTKTMPAFGPWS